MRGPRTDLVLVATLAVVSALAAAVLPADLVAVRAPAALALILALPGYALAAAIFPPRELRAAERILLSMGLSIVATILTTLLLYALEVRLTAAPWAGSLAGLAVVAAGVAWTRGHGRPVGLRRFGVRRAEIAALACALLLLGGAAALGFSPLDAPQGTQGTTALWMVPHGSNAVALGVISDERQVRTYTIQVVVAGAPSQSFGPIRLVPGGKWTHIVNTGPGAPVVRSLLHVAPSPTAIYRWVTLSYGRSALPRKACARVASVAGTPARIRAVPRCIARDTSARPVAARAHRPRSSRRHPQGRR